MSARGKARRGVRLVDAKRLFSEALSELMSEVGITRELYSDEEIASMVRECVREGYDLSWGEFMAWVLYGDDKRERTKAMIRLGRSAWRS